MGNTFRKILSAILLLALAGVGYLFRRATRDIPGVGGILLGQAVVLFGMIFVSLWLYRRFRPRM